VRAILDALLALSPKKTEIKVEKDPARERPIDADLQVPDTTKFFRHTGWKPEIPFEKTIRDLLEYWRERVRREGDRFLQR
jgi:nucleoside-diphosphate-sugar epimerase